jgi:hypothetical protein
MSVPKHIDRDADCGSYRDSNGKNPATDPRKITLQRRHPEVAVAHRRPTS